MTEELAIAMLIVTRCRREGAEAAHTGRSITDCPYRDDEDRELERAGWFDGFTNPRGAGIMPPGDATAAEATGRRVRDLFPEMYVAAAPDKTERARRQRIVGGRVKDDDQA